MIKQQLQVDRSLKEFINYKNNNQKLVSSTYHLMINRIPNIIP